MQNAKWKMESSLGYLSFKKGNGTRRAKNIKQKVTDVKRLFLLDC